jgi:hypothetical protein
MKKMEKLVLLPLVKLLQRQGWHYDAVEAALILHKMQLLPTIDMEDEVSGLLAFMYAALLTEYNLDNVYQLAIQKPDFVQEELRKMVCQLW